MSGKKPGAVLRVVTAPLFVALVLVAIGGGLVVVGVDMLAGRGWALVAAAVPLVLAGALLLRGVIHAR